MEAKAIQKYIITSPQKLREVVVMMRHLSPADAVERLPFTHKRAAEPLAKVIKAAIANARQQGASEGELVFKEIQINEGPRLRRFRAGARGRAKPYSKRLSHIRVVLETRVSAKPEKTESSDMKAEKTKAVQEVKPAKRRKTVAKGSK